MADLAGGASRHLAAGQIVMPTNLSWDNSSIVMTHALAANATVLDTSEWIIVDPGAGYMRCHILRIGSQSYVDEAPSEDTARSPRRQKRSMLLVREANEMGFLSDSSGSLVGRV